MTDFYRLHNQAQHYAWGSPLYIPQLMGQSGDGSPWAELWMGAHPNSPSRVCVPAGEVNLGELIARDPARYLGEKAARQYGALPFLLKLLAAERPLSIQAHPNLAQAREGFERENNEGRALDAPGRNYKDANHKPEIICALTPFTGMCGFREPEHIKRLLAVFLESPSVPALVRESFAPLTRALDAPSALRDLLNAVFSFSVEMRQALTEYILSGSGVEGCEWELMRSFARLYPGDPAVIAPLYLNVVRLEPGEAVFLDAGVLHAYVHGFGVELMANSDNVLRGGLSAKHIDVPELMKVLEFSPRQPRIIRPEPGVSWFTYPTPCGEFALTVLHGRGDTAAPVTLPECIAYNSPAIGIVTEGAVSINGAALNQGESFFISPTGAHEKPPVLQGSYTLYIASCGIRPDENLC